MTETAAAPLALRLVHAAKPLATIVVDGNASDTVVYAADELQHFIVKYTGVRLPIVSDPIAEPQWTIHLAEAGSPSMGPAMGELLDSVGTEGYVLQSLDRPLGGKLLITGNTPRGVLYGVYAFLEICLERITGLSPVDLEFVVTPVPDLAIPPLSRTGQPFYARRVSLAPKEPEWLARHRFNISGAEGVWSGTGSDDGLGTAVKYLADPVFEALQDEPPEVRKARREELHARLERMRQRSIDTYLFMYVTGEPTDAMVLAHPDWFGPTVPYRDSRNRRDYHPFCWSEPQARAFLGTLVQALVREYPEISGLHFRSWGTETRACQCERCGGTSPEGQELLWNLYFELIDAARAVRPNFGFYISGYNRSWLKDPDYSHVAQLPPGTILTQKWASDGEPTVDVGLSIEQLEAVGESGQEMVVLSHNVEEVAPFWMVEADLFAAGVRSYLDEPGTGALSGFTLQGTLGFGYMDQLVSGFLNWDPSGDYVAYLQNYLASRYGPDAASQILDALRLNAEALSGYFDHYAHSLAISGAYGAGSGGTASRFWTLIGAEPMEDMLNIPDFQMLEKAHAELRTFHQKQQQARKLMDAAAENIALPDVVDKTALTDYEDGRVLMELWEHFFASRRGIVDAVWLGWTGSSGAEVEESLSRALVASRAMAGPINRYQQYFLLFGYTNEGMRRLLLDDLADEWPMIEQFDWRVLDRAPPDVELVILGAEGWLTERSILLQIHAQDRFSGIDSSSMEVQEDDGGWLPPEPYTRERAWELSARDGRHRMAVRVSDSRGNWSAPITMDVLLDTTPPHGSIRPRSTEPVQNQRETQLHINAFDDMSRVDVGGQIQLSHDGVLWEEPIPYQALVPWKWAAGEGEKWVYARFRDQAGNWMEEPVSARIILDTQAPVVLETVPATDAENVDFRIRDLALHFSEVLDLRETPTISVRGSISGPITALTRVEPQALMVRLAQALSPQETVTVTLLSRIPDSVRNMLPSGYTFSFSTAPAMLPGDTNLDGRVDVNDVHTVIQHWGESGPRRPAMQWRHWRPQPVPQWDNEAAAYADANGDGIVSGIDILPLGLHWGRSRPWASGPGNWQFSGRYHQEYAQMQVFLTSSLIANERSRALAALFEEALALPDEPKAQTELLPSFPNPFSERIWFPFRLGEASDVTIRIFSLHGNLIRTFAFQNVSPGFHDSPGTAPHWDGTDSRGLPLASGSYWVQIQMAETSRTSVILLVR